MRGLAPGPGCVCLQEHRLPAPLAAAPGRVEVAAGQLAAFANGSVRPLVAIGCAITKKGSKVLPDDVRPS